MPEFAVMTFMFRPWIAEARITYEEMLAGFAAAGAEGVEPFHTDFIEDPTLLVRYRRALSDHGMRVAAVDVMCNLVYANRTQKQQDLDEMKRGLDICAELGADVAHVAGHKLRDGVSPADGRKMIAEGLMEGIDFATANGLTIAIEDFDPSPDLVCSAADCLEIMQLSGDKVEFVFDTGNFEAVNEKADQNFALLADRTCHCHFKDFAVNADSPSGYSGCDLGEGMVPNAASAKLLLEHGFDRWVALETIGRRDVSPVDAVARELPLLKSWFSQP